MVRFLSSMGLVRIFDLHETIKQKNIPPFMWVNIRYMDGMGIENSFFAFFCLSTLKLIHGIWIVCSVGCCIWSIFVQTGGSRSLLQHAGKMQR